jgi:hypothetical protein
MNRAVLLAAAGLLATGCYSSPTYVNEIDVYWQFSRNVLGPPAAVPYSCAQGGVDYVTVTDQNGVDYGPATLNCTLQDTLGNAVQGIAFFNFAVGAPYTFVVTGYRTVNGTPVALFQGQSTITFTGGANPVTVTAVGLQDDLDLIPVLYGVSGSTYVPLNSPQCDSANIDVITYNLVDGAGTSVDQAQVNCGLGVDPPVISFRVANSTGVDLDNYTVRMQGFRNGVAAPVMDSCSFAFDHFTNDTASAGFSVPVYEPAPANCH